jgi:hypothetical protein
MLFLRGVLHFAVVHSTVPPVQAPLEWYFVFQVVLGEYEQLA